LSVIPLSVRPVPGTGQDREYLLYFFDLRLLDNLDAAVKTVGGYAMTQVSLTRRRVYGQCLSLELVV